jgi:uncharacterized C2H2 Zn-finger protein
MALKCVSCGLLFRSRNELDWHIRQEHLQQRLPPTKDSRRRPRLRPQDRRRAAAVSNDYLAPSTTFTGRHEPLTVGR